ncbi:transcriptional regulator [Kitasatospora xanthocidica]|uniref:winged helix-turn-helix transcriptional regulator n=1 Tax=Kitasatospora xanthocidica TaxID=83382 RepID=UPI00167A5E54|nr:winged helix-turn-helix transcriptional regulator [Kitasatospora xanthocidica]GHF76090.1 transcriptional regulator [Kitasatospora xanthocidica]
MATKRSYNDACGTGHALDLVGERWALLVVRELLLGPKRYGQLRTDLPGISTNVLAQRLAELEASGIVRKHRLPAPAAAEAYELTDWGLELEPVVRALGRWAVRSPAHDRTAHLSPTSFVLSLRTNFDPARAQDVHGRYELHLGDEVFRVLIADGTLRAERGHQQQPEAVITARPSALARVVYGGRPLADAIAAGDVQVEGDTASVARLGAVLSLPAPVDPASR